MNFNRGHAGGWRSLERECYGNTRRRPGRVLGQPLAPLLPREPRFGPANLLARELEGFGVGFQLRHPTGAEVVVDGLAYQATDVQILAVQFDARLWPDGPEQRGAGHQVIEGHGRRVFSQPNDAANQTVFECDFAAIVTEGRLGDERPRINQPVARVRDVARTGNGCRQGKNRKPGQCYFHGARLKDSGEAGNPYSGASRADPSATTRGPHPSLPVVPLIADKRYYGETPGGLRRDCRPVSGNGPGGWRWVGGERLASLGSQPGPEVSTENAATGKGARPRRSLAADSQQSWLSQPTFRAVRFVHGRQGRPDLYSQSPTTRSL